MDRRLTLGLTPHGHLRPVVDEDAHELEEAFHQRLIQAFARGEGHGLLRLGAVEAGRAVPAVFGFWRELGTRYLTLICARPDLDLHPGRIPPPPGLLQEMVLGAPAMPGAEYLSLEILKRLWIGMERAFEVELGESGVSIQDYLKGLNPAWNLVGRVHFNLAENRRDEQAPFAFLATYTDRLSAQGKAQHLPLGQALQDYAGAANRERLLSLLLPVQRAAERCDWLRTLVDEGEVFHPLRWTPTEAIRFLNAVPDLEHSGVIVRMPASWKAGRPSRPRVMGKVGSDVPSALGMDALLDFRMAVTLDGDDLAPEEIRAILGAAEGLVLIRGQWVEVDRERLARTLERFQAIQETTRRDGLSFAEGLRMLAGADLGASALVEAEDRDWSSIAAGPWLKRTLEDLRSPEGLARVDPGEELRGTLRPYQRTGLRWLHLLSSLGLGACLADDMGLGKTIQLLALLLVQRQQRAGKSAEPNLLVAPASLLGNWAAEIGRFAPSLRFLVAHPAFLPVAEWRDPGDRLAGLDLVITSYGTLLRLPWLLEKRWNLAVVDEAQALKNPGARQTRVAKKLQSRARIALTGTPVENRLGDLWSIFDFLNPGLLGSATAFSRYAKDLSRQPHNPYGPLRDLVRPYILRRLKTDRSVIQDLPDKTEMKAYCALSRKQAALYQQSVSELAGQLGSADGIQRKGLVLSFLLRFKQICNHPSQWLGDQAWKEEDSGKLARLRELCEVIAAKQEKLLVFTQFREMTAPLAAFLGSVFGRSGLVLHGGTAVKARKDLVKRFQEDEAVPFFVLSIKAGGSGLNLTAASHVVHFDRWWNPAVENQATDRAFRIGQTRNVLVHKFVCRGTVEDRIDALIASKQQLSTELLEGGAEMNLTELGDEDLLKLVALDLHSAIEE